MSDLNFDSLFGDASLEMDCPKCNAKVPFTLSDAGKTIKCPNCSVKIELTKDDDFDNSAESINDSLNDLENAFENFGK